MKKIIRMFSVLLIALSLVGIKANALESGWQPHQEIHYETINGHNVGIGGWGYNYSNGTPAVGWAYIDNNWCYFENECYLMQQDIYSYINSNGQYVCTKSFKIDGYDYCFDWDGRMLHDCYVLIGEKKAYGLYWIDSNGRVCY